MREISVVGLLNEGIAKEDGWVVCLLLVGTISAAFVWGVKGHANEVNSERGARDPYYVHDDLARASEICREIYEVMGAYGEPWCEQWNGEAWGYWRNQADGFYE